MVRSTNLSTWRGGSLVLAFVALAACAQLRSNPVEDAGAVVDASTTRPATGDRSSFRVFREGGPGINTVFGFASDDVYAGGENSLMLHWNGSVWEPITIATGVEITSIWGRGPKDIYAVGVYKSSGRGIVYHYEGSGWLEEREFSNGLLFVRGVGDSIFVGGLKGVIHKKTPTRDWYQLIVLERSPHVEEGPNDPVLYGLAANAEDKMLVAGDLNLIYYFLGNGQWAPTYDPVDRTRAYKSAWAAPAQDWQVFVGANYNGVWLSSGKDEPFTALHEEKDTKERQEESVWGIWGTSSTQVLFVGNAGRIMVFDGGDKHGVTRLPSPTDKLLSSVWGTSWDDVWIAGAGGVVLRGNVKF